MKSTAQGCIVVVAPLYVYSDDTSGNRSKKWNRFDVFCVSLACLPKKEGRELPNIFFVGCSNRLPATEMCTPIADDLRKLEKGVFMFDSVMKANVLVIAPVICLLCDNVRASELLNHSGSSAVKLCRMCMVIS